MTLIFFFEKIWKHRVKLFVQSQSNRISDPLPGIISRRSDENPTAWLEAWGEKRVGVGWVGGG